MAWANLWLAMFALLCVAIWTTRLAEHSGSGGGCSVPGDITNVQWSISGAENQTLNVTWNPVPGATSYNIVANLEPANGNLAQSMTKLFGDESFDYEYTLVSGLEGITFTIAAINDCGKGSTYNGTVSLT